MHYIRQNWLYICKTKTVDENIPLNYCPSLFQSHLLYRFGCKMSSQAFGPEHSRVAYTPA